MTQEKEAEIINDKENLIRIVNRYRNLIFSVCLRMTGDYFAAEDLTQETFLAAYQHWKDFDGAAEKSWLCRIACNKCTDYLRSAERRAVPTENEEIPEQTDEATDPFHICSGKEVLNHLSETIDSLPDTYREIARKYFLGGMTAAEIASSENSNLKTIQTQLCRARQLLKKRIRKEDLFP